LNLIRFLSAQLPSLSRSRWMAAQQAQLGTALYCTGKSIRTARDCTAGSVAPSAQAWSAVTLLPAGTSITGDMAEDFKEELWTREKSASTPTQQPSSQGQSPSFGTSHSWLSICSDTLLETALSPSRHRILICVFSFLMPGSYQISSTKKTPKNLREKKKSLQDWST